MPCPGDRMESAMKQRPSLAEVVSGAERSVAERQVAAQARQTFFGALKVQIDQIYVGKKDGLRALDVLRQAQGAKSG